MKAVPIDARTVNAAELRRYLWIIAWSGIAEVHVDPDTQTATIPSRTTRADLLRARRR